MPPRLVTRGAAAPVAASPGAPAPARPPTGPQLRPAARPPAATPFSPAQLWGPRFLAAVGIGLGACSVAGMNPPLSIMTIAAIVGMLAGAWHPTFAALAMTCVAVLDGHAADSLQPTLATMTGGLWRYNTIGFAFLAIAVGGAGSLWRRLDTPMRLAAALCGAMILGLLWSPDPLHGAQLVLDVVAFFGMVFLFARIASDAEAWYWIGVVGGTLGAGAGLVYLITLSHIPFTNPNVAVFVPLTGLVAVCLAFAGGAHRSERQYLLAGLAMVNAVWAFLSTSRGGLLTALACLAFIGLQVPTARRRTAMLAGALILGVAVTSLFAPLQHSALQRLTLLFDPTTTVQTRTSGRSDLMIGSWQIFTKHPFGVGTGGFESTWATLGSVDGRRRFMRAGERFAAHAGWMRVLAENGVAGFVLLAAFVASFAVGGARRGGRTARNLGLLAGCGLAVSLVTTEFHLKGLFFLAAGVAAALQALPASGAGARASRPLAFVGRAGKERE